MDESIEFHGLYQFDQVQKQRHILTSDYKQQCITPGWYFQSTDYSYKSMTKSKNMYQIHYYYKRKEYAKAYDLALQMIKEKQNLELIQILLACQAKLKLEPIQFTTKEASYFYLKAKVYQSLGDEARALECITVYIEKRSDPMNGLIFLSKTSEWAKQNALDMYRKTAKQNEYSQAFEKKLNCSDATDLFGEIISSKFIDILRLS
jgi:tetratricopeptide (TPR) repeat protein